MKRLLAILTVTAATCGLVALAGELPIGTIVGGADGGTNSNATTAQPFVVPPNTKITVQCDQACVVALNDGRRVTASTVTADGGPGRPFFYLNDGGTNLLLADAGSACTFPDAGLNPSLCQDAGFCGFFGGSKVGPDGGVLCTNVQTVSFDPVPLFGNTLPDGGLSLAAGLYLAQYQLLPTSTPGPGTAVAYLNDGGLFLRDGGTSSVVRVRCVGAACNANVHVRQGNE